MYVMFFVDDGTVVFRSFFVYNSSFLLTIRVCLLTVENLCLQWESVSTKHLNGL